ncbi:MAG: DUF3160 domain-containing protein [Sedimentisphaerales bacterium]|nr:DUF3160 domain-containing protein [Sedimentisphaerales bacterium]
MTRDAWQTKSCGTVLAGWAQLRHTWILQAKLNVSSMGAHRYPSPTAFVEPARAVWSAAFTRSSAA